MKYLIKIDRSSIRRNPHYPHAYRYEVYPREMTRIDTYRGYTTGDTDEPKWVLYSQEIIEPKPQYEYVDLLGGAPKYHYDYCPTLVECEWCCEKFDYSDLEYDCSDPEYDGGWTETACPKCGFWECCQIEYEKLSEETLKGIYENRL